MLRSCPRPQVSSFSKFLWLRSDPLYQTHRLERLTCHVRNIEVLHPTLVDQYPPHFLFDASIMASNRYLIGLVHLRLFVILLDFFIPLYFITVQENRKNRKLRKQKIAQRTSASNGTENCIYNQNTALSQLLATT